MLQYIIQNLILEEFKTRVNSGNACYHSVQILLSSLLSETRSIKIYNSIILPVVLYGREICSLTLREEHRVRVFENRVLMRILGRIWTEETRSDWSMEKTV
jgi:hypothetical protein